MFVALDAFYSRTARGIGNHIRRLYETLATHHDHRYALLAPGINPWASSLAARYPNVVHLAFPDVPFPIWEQVLLPSKVVHLKPDLLHCPGNTAPLAMRRRTPLVLTIHDVMALKNRAELPYSSSWYQNAGRLYRRAILSRAALSAAAVISVSNFSRDDLLIACPNLSAEKVRVVPNGPGMSPGLCATPNPEIERFLGQGDDLIFALGAVDPRKNTARVVTAFDAFNLRARNGSYRLVVAGLNRGDVEAVDRAVARAKNRDRIHLLGDVSEAELKWLYQKSRIFLYVSLYEGFGIPILDAMAEGVSIVASDTSSIPEVLGDCGELVNPHDVGSIVEGMLVALSKSKTTLRHAMTDRLRLFEWTEIAKSTLGVFASVAAGQTRIHGI